MCNNTTANSAQEGNSETKFAGRKGKAILNKGETDCGDEDVDIFAVTITLTIFV